MRVYTHIVGAVLLFLCVAYLTSYNFLFTGIFFAGWISVFPDLLDKLTGKHRGVGHSIFWLIPLSLIGFWNGTIALALVIGFISHLFLDILTTHGCPIFYPLSETYFVSFGKKRRIKTGTNQETAVFLFMLLFMAIFLLLSTNLLSFLGVAHEDFFVFANPNDNPKSSQNSDAIKNNFYINFDLDETTNKNITVKKVNENETNILIKDIEPGG